MGKPFPMKNTFGNLFNNKNIRIRLKLTFIRDPDPFVKLIKKTCNKKVQGPNVKLIKIGTSDNNKSLFIVILLSKYFTSTFLLIQD